MYLGLLFFGMLLGGASAGYWIIAGGSALAAIGIYSLVATAFVLGTSAMAFLLSEFGIDDQPDRAGSVAPAE